MSEFEVERLRKEYEYYTRLLKKHESKQTLHQKKSNASVNYKLTSHVNNCKDRSKIKYTSHILPSHVFRNSFKINESSNQIKPLIMNNIWKFKGVRYQHFPQSFSATFSPKPFVSKYALKRDKTGSLIRRVSINKVLGRKVGNLSKNKYKFVNAQLKTSITSKSKNHVSNVLREKYMKGRMQHNVMLVKRHLANRLVFRSSRILAKPKSNKYCLFYNKFGRCHRGVKCPDIHDPDKISICTRYLRGTCNISNCPFSHKILKEKMPTCTYFLKGLCSRSDCPYSHVNVGKNAEVCKAFVDGHCHLGSECKKSHVRPDYSVKVKKGDAGGITARKEKLYEKGTGNLDSSDNSGPNFILLDSSIEDQSKSFDSSFFSDIDSWSILPKLRGSK